MTSELAPFRDPVLSSTFLLTLLLMVGLFFFIRASTKDRTEVAHYVTPLADVALLERLQTYFADRAYRVTHINPDDSRITLEGTVSASRFLAVFLSLLAATGLTCVALVLGILFPAIVPLPWGLVLLSPLAGWFYHRGATRLEAVSFQLQGSSTGGEDATVSETRLEVSAHRDELLVMERSMPIRRLSD